MLFLKNCADTPWLCKDTLPILRSAKNFFDTNFRVKYRL